MLPAAAQVRRMLGGLSLIAEAHELLWWPGDPRIFSATPTAAATERFAPCGVPSAGGVGFTRQQALETTIGECIERYSSSYYELEQLVLARGDQLGERAVGIDRFSLYAPQQYAHPDFPLPAYRADRPIYWARGRALADGAERLVPAALVYLGYRGEAGDLFSLPVSSGTACHPDPDRATLSALLEVVERDAFMITWLRSLPRTRIQVDDDAGLCALGQRHLYGPGLRYHVFDITTDLAIPTVLCLVEAQSARGPAFAAGAAARPTERDAIAKAMLEAASAITYSRAVVRRTPQWRPEPQFINVTTFEDHVRLYAEPDMGAHLRFLLDTPDQRPPSAGRDLPAGPPAEQLRRCVAAIAARGYQPIACDVTAPDVALAGLTCTRALIPGAVPLVAVHKLTALGSPRLHQVPAALGYPVSRRFNRIPHPFA